MKKYTVASFKEAKKAGDKITMLTAYDYTTAKLLDEAGVDTLLVGDSLGMVMLGYEDTLQVTLEDMIHHIKAVKRGVKRALIIGDMPFLSYHISPEEAVRNAGRMIQEGGAHAVKLEGGYGVKAQIEAILAAQIPVLGHLGLTPQSVNQLGGFKVQGKDAAAAKKMIEEAKMLEELGVFGIVLEAVPHKLASLISEAISIPTIGIGAGPGTDGQVLVIQDLLGMYPDFTPKFVKQYSQMGLEIKRAVTAYCDEVKDSSFPTTKHSFTIADEVIEQLYGEKKHEDI